MSQKILFVDDDPAILEFYKDCYDHEFDVQTESNPEKALELLTGADSFAIVVADRLMPELDGIEFLRKAAEIAPDTIRIMLTSDSERHTPIDAINTGHIFQFLNKPCPPEVLSVVLEAGLKQHQMVVAERELLEKTLNGSIKMLTEVLSMIDPQSFGQGQKIREYVRPFAEKLNCSQIWELEIAAMLSNLGFVTIPPATIQRMRSGLNLSPVERGLLVRLPEFGSKLLTHIPRLEKVADFIYFHRKNFDGTGFPNVSVDGDNILLGARILRVLVDMAELESQGTPKIQALMAMKQRTGCYDPRILQTALVCFLDDKMKRGRAISVKDLALGQVLLSAIETNEGMLMVPAETRISPTLLEKLNNLAEVGAIKEPIYVEA